MDLDCIVLKPHFSVELASMRSRTLADNSNDHACKSDLARDLSKTDIERYDQSHAVNNSCALLWQVDAIHAHEPVKRVQIEAHSLHKRMQPWRHASEY